jgi:hypothetical protein
MQGKVTTGRSLSRGKRKTSVWCSSRRRRAGPPSISQYQTANVTTLMTSFIFRQALPTTRNDVSGGASSHRIRANLMLLAGGGFALEEKRLGVTFGQQDAEPWLKLCVVSER